MVILVYDCDGVILTHTVSRQQTVNAQYYCSFFGTQPATSFEKEATTPSAEPTHHFAGECSAACSAICG